MALKLFGFTITRDEDTDAPSGQISSQLPGFAMPIEDDSYSIISGGVNGVTLDLDTGIRNDVNLILQYRDAALTAECDKAISNIMDEAIISDEDDKIVSIVLDDVDVPDNIKSMISDEFNNILDLLFFNKDATTIFRNWYVDGRIYYHAVIDPSAPGYGIQELRFLDSTKLRKVKEKVPSATNNPALQSQAITGVSQFYDYYIYSENGFTDPNAKGIKISKDSIAYCTSGVMDKTNRVVLSYIQKALKPLNQLRYMEDSLVIYRIARAPERRIFYIDTGTMPKTKSEQYVKDIMTKHKNKLTYDAVTGQVRDDRKFMTMLEDYYIPRREGGKGTEITTLPGGQNLGDIADIEYFQKKLYESLNVPKTRMESADIYSPGKATEISRDEVAFHNFIIRLRQRFSQLFTNILEKQLILKNILNPNDWELIKNKIRYDYFDTNNFVEYNELDLLNQRIQALTALQPYVGLYYSQEFVKKKILGQTDEEIDEISKQIESEGIQPDPAALNIQPVPAAPPLPTG